MTSFIKYILLLIFSVVIGLSCTTTSEERSGTSNVQTLKAGEPQIHVPLDNENDLNEFVVGRQEHVSFFDDPGLERKVKKVEVPEENHYGMAMDYKFDEGQEAVHIRWFQYLPEKWTTVRGNHMKFPGLAHTDRHGWGGRQTDGTGGWSVRTGFRDHHASPDSITGEFYVYHMGMGRWGSIYPWEGTVNRGEWTAIENYVRVNTPGEADGVIKAWVNGDLVFEKSDLRFRAAGFEQYDISEILWHIYHGGASPSEVDQHLYMRDLEIWY